MAPKGMQVPKLRDVGKWLFTDHQISILGLLKM